MHTWSSSPLTMTRSATVSSPAASLRAQALNPNLQALSPSPNLHPPGLRPYTPIYKALMRTWNSSPLTPRAVSSMAPLSAPLKMRFCPRFSTDRLYCVCSAACSYSAGG